MNLFADECVYKVTVDLLRSWGHNVLTAQEVGLSGKTDEEILAYAVMHERVLITIDMDFSNIRHYAPELHKGIIIAKIRPHNADAVHRVLEYLLNNIDLDRLSTSLVIVEQSKYRIR
jgi:predicted nuclease of predicted toxin-antitoxin system